MCFFAGGTLFLEQGFGLSACSERACLLLADPDLRPCLVTAAVHVHALLLSLSMTAVLLPTAYYNTLHPTTDNTEKAQEKNAIFTMSHSVRRSFPSIILCIAVAAPSRLMTISLGCGCLALQWVFLSGLSRSVITVFLF